jgi:hypothetical protein
MTVPPRGLQRVSADNLPAAQREAVLRVADLRSFEVAEHIRFPGASRAWASPTQCFEGQKSLRSVIPSDGQLRANGLNIRGKKALSHEDFGARGIRPNATRIKADTTQKCKESF